MDPVRLHHVTTLPVRLLPPEGKAPLKTYRQDQQIQATYADGTRWCVWGTVEAIRTRPGGGLTGYYHFEEIQVRVNQVPSGEWMPVDAEGKRIELRHWLLDALYVKTHNRR